MLSVPGEEPRQEQRKKSLQKLSPRGETDDEESNHPSSREKSESAARLQRLRRMSVTVMGRLQTFHRKGSQMIEGDVGSGNQTTEDLAQLYKQFSGGKAEMTKKEWMSLQDSIQFEFSDRELETVFNWLDRNNDGIINIDDFIYGASKILFIRTFVSSYVSRLVSKFEMPSNYDYSKTTAENYKTSEMKFYGEYADLRATRDYRWHVNFVKERQIFQDNLVMSCILKNESQPCPWVVYTCGPMGAGKGFALSWMSQNNFFPLDQIVHIDPDGFKYSMPEWKGYVERDRENAGSKCHLESGLIAEIAQEAAMRMRRHIWVDGSLRDGNYYATVFDGLRQNFPDYRIAIFFVFCTKEETWRRCSERAARTGRAIPKQLFDKSFEAPDRSLELLVSKVDFVARINNEEEGSPKLEAFERIDRSGSFEVIREQFLNTNPPESIFPHTLAPLSVRTTKYNLNHFIIKPKMLEDSHTKIIPAKLLIHKIINLSTNTSRLVRLLLVCEGKELKVTLSPLSLVNLDERARIIAQIPKEAHRFCWIYPIINFPRLEKHMRKRDNIKKGESYSFSLSDHLIDESDPDILLLLHGGFLYFDLQDKIIAVNSVSGFLSDVDLNVPPSVNTVGNGNGESRPSVSSFVHFLPPIPLQKDVIKHLKKQNRWHDVTLPGLKPHAKCYAWVNPGEKVGTQRLTQYGGLAFRVIEGGKNAAGTDAFLYPLTNV